MSNRRVLKAAQAIREVVSMSILTDIKDPRVRDVTVTFVEVSADMRMAKVHVSVMGDEGKQNLCLQGLQSSAGFLQSKIGKRIDTRYTPKIQFHLDKGMQNAMMVTRILEEVLPPEETSAVDPQSMQQVDESSEAASESDFNEGDFKEVGTE